MIRITARIAVRHLIALMVGAVALAPCLSAHAKSRVLFIADGHVFERSAVPVTSADIASGGNVYFADAPMTCNLVPALSVLASVSTTQNCQLNSATLDINIKPGGKSTVVIFAMNDKFYAGQRLAPDNSAQVTVNVDQEATFQVGPAAAALKCFDMTSKKLRSVTADEQLLESSLYCAVPGSPNQLALVQTKPKAAKKDPRTCTAPDLTLKPKDVVALCDKENADPTICVDVAGRVLAKPKLEEGQSVVVKLLSPQATVSAALAVEFDRRLFLKTVDPSEPAAKAQSDATVLAEQRVTLDGPGTLHIVVERIGGTAGGCNVKPGKQTISLDVKGTYYLSLGIAPVYSFEKTHDVKAREGDDGVNRIYVEKADQLDVVFNLVAYPWGVSEGHWNESINLGIMTGTSLTNPFRSFYVGLQPTIPIAGVGIVGGITVNVIDKLEGDLAEGQPWPDNQEVPTAISAQVGGFIGVNIEDTLFKRVFGTLFDKSNEEE